MEGLGVLDRQLVQPEGVAYLGQLLRSRLEQAQPDKTPVLAAGCRLLQRHCAFTVAVPILIVRTVNDHSGPFIWTGRGSILHPSGSGLGAGRQRKAPSWPSGEHGQS